MGIVFQQPSPVAPAISAAAGGAEQFTRFAPVLQRQQEAVAQAYAQQYATGARMAADQADRSQRGAEFAATMDARRTAEQLDSGRQAADIQARYGLEQQRSDSGMRELQERARLMQETQAAELTQRERIELSRMEMAAGAVRDNPDLTAEVKNDLLTQIHAKVSPLQARLARSRVQQEELENKAIQKKLAEADIIAANRTKFMSGQFGEFTHDVTDAEGNYLGTTLMTPDGKVIEFKREKANTAETRQAEAQVKHQERVDAYNHKRGEFYAKIEKEVDDLIERERKNATDPNATDWEERGKVLKARRREAYEMGNPPPKPAAGSNVGPGDAVEGGGRPANGAPDNKPITDKNPPNDDQKAIKADFAAVRRTFDAVPRDAGRSHPEQAEVAKNLNAAEALYDKYGDPLNMPEADRRKYLEAFSDAVAAAKKFRARTAPPPAAPAFDPTAPQPGTNAFLPG